MKLNELKSLNRNYQNSNNKFPTQSMRSFAALAMQQKNYVIRKIKEKQTKIGRRK